MRPAGMAIGGGIGGIVLLVIVMLLGGDPKDLANLASPTARQAPTGEYVGTPAEENLKQFVSVVLADTEEIWGEIFRANGEQYRQPSLVLFTGAVQSACGTASSASGPFYCPPDQDVYLDLSFFDEMSTRLGASGDFAAAYVIAHEVGHHVQNQMGLTEKVHNMRGRASEEALAAASAIGDDRLQKQSQGYVIPDAFTHGTSAQRVKWFRLGYDTGDLSRGDTFAIEYEDL